MGNLEDARFTKTDAEIIKHKIRKLIGNSAWTDADRNDLEQELALHVFPRTALHDQQRATRGTFVDRIVTNKIINLDSARRAAKRGGGRMPVPLDESHDTLLDGFHDTDELNQQLDVRNALAQLPPQLRLVAEHLAIEGPADAARSLGLTRQQLRTRMAAIAERMRALGFGEHP